MDPRAKRIVRKLSVYVAVVGLALPLLLQSREREGKVGACFSNVKTLALGFLIYANDFDDRLPPAGAWMDRDMHYLPRPEAVHCPFLPNPGSDQYGYAMRKRLGRIKQTDVKEPRTEALVFDSNLLARNAASDNVILPDFTRHKAQNVGFLDGHARPIYLSRSPR